MSTDNDSRAEVITYAGPQRDQLSQVYHNQEVNVKWQIQPIRRQ